MNAKIEKIIFDENINYIHMVFNKGQNLPIHYSNSNVYMTVVRGVLTIDLNDQAKNKYPKGTILKIPIDTKMDVKNEDKDILELIVIKAPSPKK